MITRSVFYNLGHLKQKCVPTELVKMRTYDQWVNKLGADEGESFSDEEDDVSSCEDASEESHPRHIGKKINPKIPKSPLNSAFLVIFCAFFEARILLGKKQNTGGIWDNSRTSRRFPRQPAPQQCGPI